VITSVRVAGVAPGGWQQAAPPRRCPGSQKTLNASLPDRCCGRCWSPAGSAARQDRQRAGAMRS